jgi:hypothetical protein
MKKLVSLALVAGMVAFVVSCGPSKKEQEAKEKQKQDSINAVEKQKKETDSLAAVAKLQHQKDSLKMDSVEKASKTKGSYTPTTTPVKGTSAPIKPVKKGSGKIGVK